MLALDPIGIPDARSTDDPPVHTLRTRASRMIDPPATLIAWLLRLRRCLTALQQLPIMRTPRRRLRCGGQWYSICDARGKYAERSTQRGGGHYPRDSTCSQHFLIPLFSQVLASELGA